MVHRFYGYEWLVVQDFWEFKASKRPACPRLTFKLLCGSKSPQEKVLSLSTRPVAFRCRNVRKSLNLEAYREKDF